ncbi:MAG: HAMP domain-containing protein, partial [Acidimicrobiales bacterium]
MTVRRRLLLGLLVVLAVLIAAVGVAEVVVLREVLYRRSAQGLRTELSLLAAATPASPPGAPAAGGTESSSCSSLGPLRAPPGPRGRGPGKGRSLGPGGATALAQVLAQRGIASAVVGPEGGVLACATAARTGAEASFTVPAALAGQSALARAESGYLTLDADGHHLLAIAQPLGTDTALLVTGLGNDDAAVDIVLLVTVAAGLAALLVAGLSSWPLLRSGLAPLAKVARTADAIAAGDLDKRAGLARSRDEVGQMGMAFDRMVDRLQETLSERDDEDSGGFRTPIPIESGHPFRGFRTPGAGGRVALA